MREHQSADRGVVVADDRDVVGVQSKRRELADEVACAVVDDVGVGNHARRVVAAGQPKIAVCWVVVADHREAVEVEPHRRVLPAGRLVGVRRRHQLRSGDSLCTLFACVTLRATGRTCRPHGSRSTCVALGTFGSRWASCTSRASRTCDTAAAGASGLVQAHDVDDHVDRAGTVEQAESTGRIESCGHLVRSRALAGTPVEVAGQRLNLVGRPHGEVAVGGRVDCRHVQHGARCRG